ncbi:MAG: TIGR01620 family protein [Phyllobacteriaceae bacterium]|nr:TIGR01620 family protein [Phyllobacteriaceae bacterium]MBA90395.1 TIGR01620 family protein [Phyllobacteriaceae bacterium]
MTDPRRKPAAFSVAAEPDESPSMAHEGAPRDTRRKRKPAAISGDALAHVTPEAEDPFLAEALEDAVTPMPPAPARGFSFARLFAAAFGLLVALATGLWIDGLIRDLFSRADWLGWTAAGLAALAALALFGIVLREMLALARLSSIARLQAEAADALVHRDTKKARTVVDGLVTLFKDRPETRAGRDLLARQEREIVDGPDLLALAETDLLGPLDDEATRLVVDAARRVSVVTAVSPRALVDLGYVLFEAARLIRRISVTYGGRPGTLGFFRLARSVVSHLAVTGTLAATDSIVGQVLGHGLASRLSARLGEGIVNGLMTARIGLAAMDACRPMPFSARKRPGLRGILATLTRLSGPASGAGTGGKP